MNKVLLILSLATLLPAMAPARQKTKSQTGAGRLSDRAAIARTDLILASKEYKASLETLLPFEEDECKRAAEEVELRKQLLAEGADIKKRDVEDAERRLASAEARLKETRRQLLEADESIAEAMKPIAESSPTRTKRSVKRSKSRRPAQKLPPGVKEVKYPRITA